jgi:hypothetical protein
MHKNNAYKYNMFTKQMMMKYIFIHIARPANLEIFKIFTLAISKSLALFSIWQIRRTGEQVYTIAYTNVT